MQPETGYGSALSRPRRSSDEATAAAFAAGDLSRVLEFTSDASPQALLLRARVQLRIATPTDALETLAAPFVEASFLDVVRRHVLRATALVDLGEFAQAESELEQGGGARGTQQSTIAKAYLDLATVRLALKTGAYQRAERALPDLLEQGSLFDVAGDEPHERRELLIETRLLEAELAGVRLDLSRQRSAYARALDLADDSVTADPWLVADIAARFARTLAIYPDGGAVEGLRQRLLELRWTADCRRQQFEVASAFEQLSALDGDRREAFRYNREALICAPSLLHRLDAQCGRALLAQRFDLDGTELYAEDLELAAGLAKQISWQEASRRERSLLLTLAHVFARSDSRRGEAYLALYEQYDHLDDRPAHDMASALLSAEHDYVLGLLAQQRPHERGTALLALERAFRAYAALKCEERATTAALEILELERHGQALSTVERFAERHERSWIAERFRRSAPVVSNPILDEKAYFWIS